MIKEKKEMDASRSIETDLTGPDGIAFAIFEKAKNFGRQLGYSKEEIDAIVEEMQSGDYENLINVFEKEFGDFIVLYR
jgi:hypothetical protein